MWPTHDDPRTIRRLKDDLANERTERERLQRDVEEERERARNRRDEERRERLMTARSWSDAFQKNAARLRAELAQSQRELGPLVGEGEYCLSQKQYEADLAFWQGAIEANERAAAIYHEAEGVLLEMRRKLMEEAAARLEAEDLPCGSDIARALLADDPSALLDW